MGPTQSQTLTITTETDEVEWMGLTQDLVYTVADVGPYAGWTTTAFAETEAFAAGTLDDEGTYTVMLSSKPPSGTTVTLAPYEQNCSWAFSTAAQRDASPPEPMWSSKTSARA